MVVAVFYVSGGLAAFFVALFEGDVQRRGWVAAMGLVAIPAGLLIARFPTSVPPLTRRLMNVGGTGFILVVVLVAGRDTGGEALFWLFCYVPLDSAVFFPWRMAIPMMGWGVVATGIAVFGGHFLSPAAWFILVMVALVMAFTLTFLIRSAAEAEWDPTNGMLTRRGFDRALAQRCDAAQDDHPFSLAVISIDAGERPRDTVGDAAESLRRRLAGRWSAEAPGWVSWARLYDNRFAVISDDAPGFDAYLETVRASVADLSTVSIGVADNLPGDTPLQMMTKALAGLVYSEGAGGDCVTRQGLVAAKVEELRFALANNEIAVYYQPIVDLTDGRVRGGEALARWVHPDRGLIGPDEFIGLAEQSGLIAVLGEQVLRTACDDAAGWRCDGAGQAKVTVNVSGQQLRDPDFIAIVRDSLDESGLDARRLVLEVTESTVGGDDPTALVTLERLRTLGVRIAIDDFGTGYSNLSRLAGMPVDILKLDRSFVIEIETNARSRALVRGLIAMATELDLVTVAEGVETVDQARAVRALGCGEGQGWLWGRPVAKADFALDVVAPIAAAS